jgi:hypothetical protein
MRRTIFTVQDSGGPITRRAGCARAEDGNQVKEYLSGLERSDSNKRRPIGAERPATGA